MQTRTHMQQTHAQTHTHISTHARTHAHTHTHRFEFFNHSPILSGQIRYETEFDWGGTRIFVSSAIVENLRVWCVQDARQYL